MTDFEIFSKHWNNAIYGLVGRMKKSVQPVLTEKEINVMWREELLTNRFHARGIPSEAKAFMDELYERRPVTARKVNDMISKSVLHAGLNGWQCAAKAAGAVSTAALALGSFEKKNIMNSVLKTAAGAASVTFTGAAAVDLVNAGKDKLARDIVKQARGQLEVYRPLFENSSGNTDISDENRGEKGGAV